MGNYQSGGAVDLSAIHHPRGQLGLDADQSNLVHGAQTKVLLDTIAPSFEDAIEDVVNHRILPGVAGIYEITAEILLYSVVALKNYRISLAISGSSKAYAYFYCGIADMQSLHTHAIMQLTAEQYVEVFVTSYADENTVDIQGWEHNSWLNVQRIGE